MACLANLKQDIKFLESVFPKDHKVFQILSASVDELTCRFVSRDGRKYDVHANIMVSGWWKYYFHVFFSLKFIVSTSTRYHAADSKIMSSPAVKWTL